MNNKVINKNIVFDDTYAGYINLRNNLTTEEKIIATVDYILKKYNSWGMMNRIRLRTSPEKRTKFEEESYNKRKKYLFNEMKTAYQDIKKYSLKELEQVIRKTNYSLFLCKDSEETIKTLEMFIDFIKMDDIL